MKNERLIMKLENYLNKGFILSPYYQWGDIDDKKKIVTRILSKEEIRLIIIGSSSLREDILYSNNEIIFIKFSERYHVTPIDLLIKFEEVIESEDESLYDKITEWASFIKLSDNKGKIFFPILNDDYNQNDSDGIEDYLFKKDDHIVSFMIRLIKTELREDKANEDLSSYLNFLNNILLKRDKLNSNKDYDIPTYSLILDSLSYELYKGKKFDKDLEEFYRTTLYKCALSGDERSMRSIGYEYYEGCNGFDLDPHKSLYWLEKYFKATGDPDVARTIGYIYYYGRTTDGVPQGDKAFQYFAIGHLAGGYFEATYKLADCYIKGYGTPISYQAAYNLVRGIYNQTKDYFLNGEDSKFADVALRLGSYYKDGIHVDKNLELAHSFYL